VRDGEDVGWRGHEIKFLAPDGFRISGVYLLFGNGSTLSQTGYNSITAPLDVNQTQCPALPRILDM
jgi:hypothetical protein